LNTLPSVKAAHFSDFSRGCRRKGNGDAKTHGDGRGDHCPIAGTMEKYKPALMLPANDTREVPFQDLINANTGWCMRMPPIGFHAE
jgi:hypothetical protein